MYLDVWCYNLFWVYDHLAPSAHGNYVLTRHSDIEARLCVLTSQAGQANGTLPSSAASHC